MHKAPTPTAITNIATIARLEQESLEAAHRGRTSRRRHRFLYGYDVLRPDSCRILAFWIPANFGLIPGIKPFDPFPYMLLSMSVSIEGVLLTTFVLMKQNRMSKRADARNQLNLQVDLLAEKEVTKILQMLRAVCEHMGLEQQAHEPEVKELSEKTAVESLARELKEKIPD